MSGSGEYTTTPNLGLYKPTYNADAEQWGNHLNANADVLDGALAGGGPFLPLTGGTMQGPLVLGAGTHIASATNNDVTIYPAGLGGCVIGVNHTYAGPATEIFRVNANLTGTITGGAKSGAGGLYINSDNVDATGAQGGGLSGFDVAQVITAGAKGGRTAFGAVINQVGTTTMSQPEYYVAASAYASADHGCGGTSGAYGGSLFASNDSVLLKTGAGLYWNGICGYELDVGAQAGTGLAYKNGMKVVQWAGDAVSGSAGADTAYGIAAQSSNAGWDVGYCIGDPNGWWPMKATGRLIGTLTSAFGPAYTAAWGIDFSAVTFSGGLIRGPGGVSLGSGTVASAINLSRHLDLFGGQFGMSVSDSGTLSIVTQGSGLSINVSGSPRGFFDATGLNNMTIGQEYQANGSFTHIQALNGMDFGANTVATFNDFSRHINLFNGQVGFTVTSGGFNYVAGGAHIFWSGGANNGYISNGLNNMKVGEDIPANGSFSQVKVGSTTGPTIRAGAGAATGTQPSGSIWLRTDGTTANRLYVTSGGGTWLAVAGV